MSSFSSNVRVLSIAFTNHGFGFVVMEGTKRLIDWGVSQSRKCPASRIAHRAQKLMERYHPQVIVVEDILKNRRRSAKCRDAQLAIKTLARSKRVRYRRVSSKEIRKTFAAGKRISKDDIAEAIAERYPELGSRLPPRRKAWKGERPRMAIFMAAACAITYYARKVPKCSA